MAETISKPTKEEWAAFEKSLEGLFGRAEIIADGFNVSYSKVHYKNRLYIMTYINGFFKGEWLSDDCIQRQKFCRVISKALFSEKEKRQLRKAFRYQEPFTKAKLEKRLVFYSPDWNSARAIRLHLLRTCIEIKIKAKAEFKGESAE